MAVTLLLAAGAAWAAGEADGIIVKLRDAPAHADIAREKAQSSEHRSARGEAARQKLDRVLREAAVDQPGIDVPSAPRIRSAGRDAQLLRYDRLLTQEEAERLVKRLRERADVEWAVPNTLEQRKQASTAYQPNDDLFGSLDNQWWLLPVQGAIGNELKARLRGVPGFQTAWRQRGNGIGLVAAPVAVLDSGILFDHPDLPSSQLLPGYDFVSDTTAAADGDEEDNNPRDEGDFCGSGLSSWHGTKIAGLIAAQTNNDTGVAAIHWAGSVLPVRIAGRCGARVLDIVNGIRWAAGLEVDGVPVNPNPVRVINISYGGTAACDAAYQAAINEVRTEKGAVVIAAAGNEHTAPTRPANCNNVIGVGALNRAGFKATYSNFGPQLVISTVGGDPTDRGAWGALGDTGILTITNKGPQTPGTAASDYDYASVFGTSFSAPLVSGTVSLMLGINPDLTADQIVDGLKVSARRHVGSAYIGACSASNPGRCICTVPSTTIAGTCGAGILDADEALRYAANPGGYVRTAAQDSPVSVDSPDVIALAQAGQDRPANPTTPTEPAGPCGRDNVCGGALQPGWLLGLLAASGALLWRRRGRVARGGVRA